MQERVGRDLDGNEVSIALDDEPRQPPDRRLRLALRRAERTEIMITDERRGGGLHALVIERAMNMRGPLLDEGRAHVAVEDHIPIRS